MALTVAKWPILKPVLLGITIWMLAVLIGTCWWGLLMVGTDRDPTNYAYARSYLQGSARMGTMPSAVEDRRLSAVRAQLFRWIVAQVWPAVLLSSLMIPVLVLLLIRYPHDRWIALSLALVCAGAVPYIALMIAVGWPDLSQTASIVGQSTAIVPTIEPSFPTP